MLKRSKSLACALSFLVCFGTSEAIKPAHAQRIEPAHNLAADARAAAQQGKPLLLFVTQPGCPFCERARREYLRHLAVDPAYTRRLLFRELSIEGKVTGFDGKRSSGLAAARALKIKLYPTIVIVDGAGEAIAAPLVGFTVPDFYAAQIDGRIEEAELHLAARIKPGSTN